MMNMDSWASMSEPNDNLMIVDGLNLAFRWKHKGARDFAGEYVKTINSLARSYHAKKIVVLVDYKGSRWRKHIFPEYKANRKEKFANQTEEEKLAADLFFEDFEKAIDLASRNFEVVRMEGVEADDTATYLVERFEDGEVFEHIWLISTDQDWDELLGNTVSRFAYTSRKEFTIQNFYDLHECDTPEQFTSVKAIMGDAGDNVIGVGGIGKKRAYNLVREHGDAMDIADKLPIAGNQLYIQELNKSQDKLYLNVQLVDLRSFYQEAIAFPSPENLLFMDNLCNRLEGA